MSDAPEPEPRRRGPVHPDPLLERVFPWSLFLGFLTLEVIVLVSIARLLL